MKNNHLSAAETCPKVSGSFFALSSVAQTKTVISTNIQVVKFAFVCVLFDSTSASSSESFPPTAK